VGKLKKVGIGFGIPILILISIYIAGVTWASNLTPEEREEMFPYQEKPDFLPPDQGSQNTEPEQESSEISTNYFDSVKEEESLWDIGFKPYDEIKQLKGKYSCDVINNGLASGIKATQEELLFWLNFCMQDLVKNEVYDEPVTFTELSQEYIGISYCNTLDLMIKRGDKMWKDELGDYFLWCVPR